LRSFALRPRRSVVVGALASVIVGTVLAATALPALADSLVVTPTTTLTTASTSTTSTPTTTTSTPARHRAAVQDHSRAALRPRATQGSIQAVAPRRHTIADSSSDTTPTTTATTVSTTTPPTTTPPTTVPKPATVSVPNVALKLGSNIAPNPDFLASGTGSLVNGVVQYQNPCVQNASWPHFTNDPSCTNYILQAINNARSVEGVKPMTLPTNWYSLSTPQQLFVVADLERVDRGLPPYLGLNANLTSAAQHAAATRSDPAVAAGFPIGTDAQGAPAFGGAWAGGFNVLVADYVWMYDDGWGGANNTSNIACTSPGAAGCWAHREELLGYDPGYNPGVGLACTTCEMGTGFAMVNGTSASYVDLIEMPKAGTRPAMSFTWAEEQQYL
ncbi:MAG TPA: hypothetical protein VGS61_07600, partial [Acidimicrobiales bacterium]|nr:hypothetical protein [Acidimicrobiales bacterium]